jgi:hypothetical protein
MNRSYFQTLCYMRIEIELGCILFPLIILEMFLQLDCSPPVVHSIDWKLFGKAHTCLYEVPQLTVHVRTKTKPRGWRNSPESSETGLCRVTDMGKGTKTFLQHWRSPRKQWPSSFFKWKKFRTTKTLPRPGPLAKRSNQGRRALVREVTKNSMVTLTELQSSSVEMGEPSRRTIISANLHQLGLLW